jgi:flagellar protein FlaG
MPGTSASHTIWFIASLVVSASICAALIGVVHMISDGIEKKGEAIVGQLNSEIKIINDEYNVPYYKSTNILIIYVKNVGRSILNSNKSSILVLVNGSSYTPTQVTILTKSSSWNPGSVIQINVTVLYLQENMDYSIRVEVSDLKSSVSVHDTIVCRIRWV